MKFHGDISESKGSLLIGFCDVAVASLYLSFRQNNFFCKSKEISTSVALTFAKYSSPSVF